MRHDALGLRLPGVQGVAVEAQVDSWRLVARSRKARAVRYLRIRNWERFQHYKDRRPPWVKFYVELLDDPEVTSLPIPTQLLMDRLLLVAAKCDNRIVSDAKWIANAVHMDEKHIRNGLKQLRKIGFLEPFRGDASIRLLAERSISAMPETETEKETDIPQTPFKLNDEQPIRLVAP